MFFRDKATLYFPFSVAQPWRLTFILPGLSCIVLSLLLQRKNQRKEPVRQLLRCLTDSYTLLRSSSIIFMALVIIVPLHIFDVKDQPLLLYFIYLA
jgi:hypothetical protein